MFRFADPYYLYFLLLIPLFTVIYLLNLYIRKRRLSTFGDPELVKTLSSDYSSRRKQLKFVLLMIFLGLMSIILARPQFGTKSNVEEKTGIEIIIATDVSNSMLCRDVSPSRLDKAKMIMGKLIDQFENDRVGLVAFAGSAVTILPITSDYISAKIFLDQLSPEMLTTQGTNMAEGIRCAISSFSTRKDIGKALILITDAEDHEDGAISAAEEAHSLGINVYVMSVGTESGGPIPMPDGRMKLDREGNEVTTCLNPTIGKEIATAGEGIYMNIDNTLDAEKQLQREISNLKKATYSSSSFGESNEQFVLISLILLILVIIDACIIERKNSFLNIFKNLR